MAGIGVAGLQGSSLQVLAGRAGLGDELRAAGFELRVEAELDLAARLDGFGGGHFAGDFRGRLVFAEAEEGGLADEVVGGPGGEADLGDEFGLDPVDAAAGVGGAAGRRASSSVSSLCELGRGDRAWVFWVKPVPVRPA